ncbi:DNA alkylation repair protein [Sphingobacterium corticis]|uniref:DNA alkylation repair protein n=1 Tax=Sphingobacterium corticis TaxID=1812823 RepID=A0ABW5NQ73_9SPHI
MQEILDHLASLSNESTYAHNTKYGATNQYGVKLGDIRQVAKSTKKDKQLAISLWETGIADAQLLATLIVNPKQLSLDEVDEMVRTINFSQVADWFSAYLLKDRTDKRLLYDQWIESDNKWAQRAAWNLLSGFIARNTENINLDVILKDIEKNMSSAAPEIQWTMNTALAQIGIHHEAYREQALSIGEKLGVYRDYPVSKGCTSPFAPIWINEMVSRKNNKA